MKEYDRVLFTKYMYIFFVAMLAYLSYLIVRPFVSYILVSLMIAYLVYPFNKKMTRVLRSRSASAVILTVLILALMFLPLILGGNRMVTEIINVYEKTNIDKVESIISSMFGGKLDNYIGPFLQKGMDFLLNQTSGFLLSLPLKLIGLIIALGVLFFAFRDGDHLVDKIRMVLPLSREDKDKVIDKFKHTMDATVYGTITMAVVEGVVATLIFWVFGVKTPVIWGLLMAVISMLPFLGPAFVWLPLSIYMYVTVSPAVGFAMGIVSLLVVSLLLDIFLKNKIIGKKGEIHPVVVLLGVIGGVSVFGIIGFILGPFILSLLLLFIGVLFNNNEIQSKRH
ncbi:MAG: AI-2E family transporter [Candidatus Woesearchaeota archaeon]